MQQASRLHCIRCHTQLPSTQTPPPVLHQRPCMIAETSFSGPALSPASVLLQLLQHLYGHLLWPPQVLGDEVMATIPQTLQLTKAQKQQKSGGGNPAAAAAASTYFGMAEMDQPMRYNSKLMNSIWGRYNEHSVHNFKSLQCGGVVAAAAGTQISHEVGQTLLQPPSPNLSGSSAMKRRLRELGEAVSTNFMDNLNQY